MSFVAPSVVCILPSCALFNVGLGACGKVNKDSEHIVAISSVRFNNARGGNHVTGGLTHNSQFVQITNKKNGKKAFGLVCDSCPGCADGDLGNVVHQCCLVLTRIPHGTGRHELFQALGAPLSQGVVNIEWHFEPKGFKP